VARVQTGTLFHFQPELHIIEDVYKYRTTGQYRNDKKLWAQSDSNRWTRIYTFSWSSRGLWDTLMTNHNKATTVVGQSASCSMSVGHIQQLHFRCGLAHKLGCDWLGLTIWKHCYM